MFFNVVKYLLHHGNDSYLNYSTDSAYICEKLSILKK